MMFYGIEEEDLELEWEEFTKKFPDIPREQYDAGQKAIQEI